MNGINLKRMDWAMLGTILILIGLSAVFIYSAQFKSDADPVGTNWIKQLAFAGMGLCAYMALVWYDYQTVARLSWFIY
jgi:cell division protein FtsW (lipid II flippase)